MEIADFEGLFYTGIGTHVHSLLQLFLANAPLGVDMFGNWKCMACGSVLQMQFKPQGACMCGTNMPHVYDEIKFRVGNMTGHLDFLAQYNRNFWMALEFKTTGELSGWGVTLPKLVHFIQIRTYIAMLKLVYNINVDGYGIVYYSRKNGKYRMYGPYGTKSRKRATDDIFAALKGFKAATVYRKAPTLDKLQAVIEHRPCKSQEDYDRYMGLKYEFQKSPCPLLASCCKSDKAVLKTIRTLGEQ